ncbi:MAG: asparagine synthase-related protein [Nocardioidaceae bacterium]
MTPTDLKITVPLVWRASVYYGWRGRRLLASTSIRALAAALETREPDLDGTASFLACGYALGFGDVPSLIRGIRRIEPGHSVTITPAGTVRSERDWRPERTPRFCSLHPDDVLPSIRRHLDAAVDRLASDGRSVACLLSGGLDSSLVAATLLRRCPEQFVLINVGSGLGTPAEAALRSRLLGAYQARSQPVDLPREVGLIGAIRRANRISHYPVSCLFAHAFEAFTEHAASRGCHRLVTGDGGDEVFAERDLLLADLLGPRHYRARCHALGYFAVRDAQRSSRGLAKARAVRRFLSGDGPAPLGRGRYDSALYGSRAGDIVDARATRWEAIRLLWLQGWPVSAVESCLRAAGVPEWEPIATSGQWVSPASPLASPALLLDEISVRRDQLVQPVVGFRPKWLLRLAALDRLPPAIAWHPKIGSADSQILAAIDEGERFEIVDLLTGSAARSVGIDLADSAQRKDSPLWLTDAWVRPTALTAWVDSIRTVPPPRPVELRPHPSAESAPTRSAASTKRRMSAVSARRAASSGAQAGPAAAEPLDGGRRPRLTTAVAIALLNAIAQVAPRPLVRGRSPVTAGDAVQATASTPATTDPRHDEVTAAARLACALPLVSGSDASMTHAVAWYLRLTGTPAAVTAGTAQGDSAVRLWVKTRAGRIDVRECATPLTPFPGP